MRGYLPLCQNWVIWLLWKLLRPLSIGHTFFGTYFLVSHIFGTKFLGPTFSLNQIFFWPISFFDQQFLGLTFLLTQIFLLHNFFGLNNFFYQNIFMTKKTTHCLGPNFFEPKICWPKICLDPDFSKQTNFWTQNFFRSNIFMDPQILDLFVYPVRMLIQNFVLPNTTFLTYFFYLTFVQRKTLWKLNWFLLNNLVW